MRHLTEEHKRKIGEANRIALKGKKQSAESNRKRSMSLRGRPVSLATRQKLSKSNRGQKRSAEARRHMSESHKGKPSNRLGARFTPEQKQRLSKAIKRLWANPEYKRKCLLSIAKGHPRKQNKKEKLLDCLLQDLFPRHYKYVGNGEILINGKNPDFINIHGQKKVIEFFGNYWHGSVKTGMTNTEHRRIREAIFSSRGYLPLIIWEHELRDIPRLVRKLKHFHHRR